MVFSCLSIYLFIDLGAIYILVIKYKVSLKRCGLVNRNLVWNYEALIRNTKDRVEDEWAVGIRSGDMNNSGTSCLDLDLGIVS